MEAGWMLLFLLLLFKASIKTLSWDPPPKNSSLCIKFLDTTYAQDHQQRTFVMLIAFCLLNGSYQQKLDEKA